MYRETNLSRRISIRTVSIAAISTLLFFGVSSEPFGPNIAQAQGAGDLVVAPTRVVLEGRTRSQQLALVNKGAESATYRITIINMRMGENGSMTEISEPAEGEAFADRLVRYSPRQITLAPGASQAVRLIARKPKDLAPGEYRSHMMFRSVPQVQTQSIENAANQGSSAVLIPVFGIAIPVIIRHGELEYAVELSNGSLMPPVKEGDLPRLKFDLSRTGNRSAFGDLSASVMSGGDEVILGQIRRLAVYTPNPSRTVEMILRVPEGVKLAGNNIKLTYKTIPDEGARLLSETSIAVP